MCRYTEESDVWSLGVAMWEVFSFGHQPYDGMGNQEVLCGVYDGNIRLEKPPGCPEVIYGIMRSCWESQPKERPAASGLAGQLQMLEDWRGTDGYEVPLEWLACGEQTESDGGHCCSKSRTVHEFRNIEKRHSDTSDGLHGTGVTPGSLLTTSFSSTIPSLCNVLNSRTLPIL